MNYANIKYCDIANGSGVRTSLFVSGCTHKCKNCFNQEAWDFKYGKEYTEEVQKEILNSLSPSYISGLTLLGGEPLHPLNQQTVLELLREIKKYYPQKNIWCYTGYSYKSDFIEGGSAYTGATEEILELIDVLVDGKYIDELYDIRLRFRGSSNQRIIDLKVSREKQRTVLWEG